MTSVLVILRDALVAFVHQRLLLVLFIAALGGTGAFAYFVSWQERTLQMVMAERSETATSVNQDRREVEQGLEQMKTSQQALFFGVASFGGTVMALLLFSTIVASPLQRRELRGILVRPLTRSQYLLGRFLAAVVALSIYWILMSLILWAFSCYQTAGLPPAARYAAVLYFCKTVMSGAIVFALSLFVRPAVAVALAFFASSDWVPAEGWLYYVLPGDDRLSTAMRILHGTLLAPRDLVFAALYALNVTIVALSVARLRFDRLDIA